MVFEKLFLVYVQCVEWVIHSCNSKLTRVHKLHIALWNVYLWHNLEAYSPDRLHSRVYNPCINDVNMYIWSICVMLLNKKYIFIITTHLPVFLSFTHTLDSICTLHSTTACLKGFCFFTKIFIHVAFQRFFLFSNNSILFFKQQKKKILSPSQPLTVYLSLTFAQYTIYILKHTNVNSGSGSSPGNTGESTRAALPAHT